jgi:PIN domain nuclease of toxin-antitoxin system
MAAVVFDASALIALLRGEQGAETIAGYIGDGLVSAVNLQEVVKALLRRGIPLDIARDMVAALHLEVRAHARDDAFAAAALYKATERYGSGLGDRTCMALAIAEKLPALTTDKAWAQIDIMGLEVILAR